MLGSLDLYLHEQAPHFSEGWGVPFPNSGYCLRDHEGSGNAGASGFGSTKLPSSPVDIQRIVKLLPVTFSAGFPRCSQKTSATSLLMVQRT